MIVGKSNFLYITEKGGKIHYILVFLFFSFLTLTLRFEFLLTAAKVLGEKQSRKRCGQGVPSGRAFSP